MVEVKGFRCDFCRKGYFGKGSCTKHERRCFRNPNREVRLGELTTIGQALGPSGELGERDWRTEEPPPWWPSRDWEQGLGCIFTPGGWARVPGWELVTQPGPAEVDHWPEAFGGNVYDPARGIVERWVPLIEVPNEDRLKWLAEELATEESKRLGLLP